MVRGRYAGARARRARALGHAAIAIALLSGPAHAAGNTPVDHFEPAPAGDTFFSVPDARVAGALRPAAAVAVTYGDGLLGTKPSTGGPTTFVVSQRLTGHALVALELARRIKLDVDVPVVLEQTGGKSVTASLDAPPSAALGDLRFGARLELLRQQGAFPAAAIALDLWAPTANGDAYAGTGTARFAPSIVLGADLGRIAYSAWAARRFASIEGGANLLGSDVDFGAGVAARVSRFTLGVEGYGYVSPGSSTAAVSTRTAGMELLAGARARAFRLLDLGFAGGPGFGHGIGTPSVRLVFLVGIAPPAPPPRDDDASGRDGAAAIAVVPVVATKPADRDGDGVPDTEDACPDVPGDASPKAKRRGCPADRDGDGIPDAEDKCPDVPGVDSTDPARVGCPPDTDGDGIPDDKDACPRDKGEASPDPKLNGCPRGARVEGAQIVISEQVRFATGSDVIEKVSYPILQQVLGVLEAHPEIARLAVDGHTDDVGREKANVALSQRRAVSVMRWLTERGVDARRLEARGYGPRRPLDPAKTPEARAKNRRVEFQIRLRTHDGPQGWRDGPID